MRILVVEGNTPDVLARGAQVGAAPAAETFGATLRRLDGSVEIAVAAPYDPSFDAGAAPPPDADAVALTGSGVSWSADAPEARPYLAYLDRVLAAGKPVFGACWGLQTVCVALGGAVRVNPRGVERGVARAVALTEAGRGHGMFADKPPTFDTVCIHRDDVAAAPSGAEILAGNDHSPIQALAYEQGGVRFWGAQYHPELSLANIADYVERPGENVLAARPEDVRLAETYRAIDAGDGAAAARHAVGADVLSEPRRARELSNWLAAIRAAASPQRLSGADLGEGR